MRQLIFILLAIIGVSQAQTIQYIGAPTTTVISRGNFRTDSIFYLPKRTKLPTDTAALRYQISDSSLYAWTGSQWRKVGADADTLVYSTRAWRQKGDDSLAARINLKVNISDTASMLTPYLRKSDTTAMLSPYYRSATASAALALKLNISDTATMLSPYYRSATATSALATKLNISDTASMLSPYYRSATATAALATKLNISDTSTMLSPYARTATVNASLATKLNISDTSIMLGNYVRHAGYGLTKSGQSFLVDTLNIATRAWRQKGIDSVASLISGGTIGGSGTTNYVPKFTAGSTIGNSQIQDNGSNIGYNVTPKTWFGSRKAIEINGGGALTGVTNLFMELYGNSYLDGSINYKYLNNGSAGIYGIGNLASGGSSHTFYTAPNGTAGANATFTAALNIFSNARIGINTTTDAGYQLDVNGNGRYIGAASTNSGLIVQNSTGASGTAQYYMDFGTSATLISRMFRGNGLSGTTANGLNIDNFEGFQIRANQLGGSGGTINLMGGNVGIGTASPDTKLNVIGNFQIGNGFNFGNAFTINRNVSSLNDAFVIRDSSNLDDIYVLSVNATTGEVRHGANDDNGTGFHTFYAGNQYGMGLTASRELLINTTSDAGDYKLQVSGNIYNTGSAVLAATSGNVGIGVTPSAWGGSISSALEGRNGSSIAFGFSTLPAVYYGSNTYYDGGNWVYKQTGNAAMFSLNNNAGNYIWNTAASGTAGNTITWSQGMTLNNSNELFINTTSDAGDYKLQVAGNAYATGGLTLTGTGSIFTRNTANTSGFDIGLLGGTSVADAYVYQRANAAMIFATNNTERGRINSAGEWIIDASGTDAGDYKLQVVGNARIGTGKLDIASNTTFGLGVARSGTTEVAGQIYNSNGILYLGAESSAGGQIFSGSSAYAAVIGSGANYPLQFATNNATRATIDTDGDLGIATTAPTEKLDVNGRARIRTIDSTSTAINLLYADVDGVIKKAPVSASGISGSGTTNYIPKFTSGSALGNSILYENNSELFINTTSDQGSYKLQVNGAVYNTGNVTRGSINVIGTGGQITTDSTTNLPAIYMVSQSITGSSANPLITGNTTWNTSGSPSLIDMSLTNTASGADANYIRITDGTNLFRVTKDAGIITGNPSSGTAAKWKLGSKVDAEVAVDTSKYIEVEIGGVYYRLAIVTPL